MKIYFRFFFFNVQKYKVDLKWFCWCDVCSISRLCIWVWYICEWEANVLLEEVKRKIFAKKYLQFARISSMTLSLHLNFPRLSCVVVAVVVFISIWLVAFALMVLRPLFEVLLIFLFCFRCCAHKHICDSHTHKHIHTNQHSVKL